jgi:hypothetical protein
MIKGESPGEIPQEKHPEGTEGAFAGEGIHGRTTFSVRSDWKTSLKEIPIYYRTLASPEQSIRSDRVSFKKIGLSS